MNAGGAGTEPARRDVADFRICEAPRSMACSTDSLPSDPTALRPVLETEACTLAGGDLSTAANLRPPSLTCETAPSMDGKTPEAVDEFENIVDASSPATLESTNDFQIVAASLPAEADDSRAVLPTEARDLAGSNRDRQHSSNECVAAPSTNEFGPGTAREWSGWTGEENLSRSEYLALERSERRKYFCFLAILEDEELEEAEEATSAEEELDASTEAQRLKEASLEPLQLLVTQNRARSVEKQEIASEPIEYDCAPVFVGPEHPHTRGTIVSQKQTTTPPFNEQFITRGRKRSVLLFLLCQ